MHFSDKFSYKILFIPSYGLENMNLARFAYLQEFWKTEREKKTARAETSPDLRRRIAFVAHRRRKEKFWWAEAQLASDLNNKKMKKVEACLQRDSNQGSPRRGQNSLPLRCYYDVY
jgi:hypothetical protein